MGRAACGSYTPALVAKYPPSFYLRSVIAMGVSAATGKLLGVSVD